MGTVERAARSVEPPGGNATTMRIGFVGQACAAASEANDAAQIATMQRASFTLIPPSFLREFSS